MSEFLHKLFTIILTKITDIRASTVAQTIKNLPEMQETWVWFLGQEDPLQKGMAICSSMAQQVKNLPAMQETQEMRVLSLGLEDPLEEEMATHSNILAWEISRRE